MSNVVQEIANWVLGSYKVRAKEVGGGLIQEVAIVDADGNQVGGSSIDVVYYNGAAYPVKDAIIEEPNAGDNEVVAAVPGKRIVPVLVRVMSSGDVTIRFRSASTNIDGPAYLTANSGYVLPFCPVGLFKTAVGEALNLNLSAAIPVGGYLRYVEI